MAPNKLGLRAVDITKPHGVEEVYFYGLDEATGERLARQKPAWKAIQEAGGKTFVAGHQWELFNGNSLL